MNDKKSINKSSIKVTRNFIIAIISILVILFFWAGLTKAGYIKNYLGIEILCPETELIKPQETSSNTNNTDFPYYNDVFDSNIVWKPVIYLYPQKKIDVLIQLDYAGEIIADYPEYNRSINGWNVLAYPDGHLINKADNKEYSYLFWEGKSNNRIDYDLSTGFLVNGENIKVFLQNTLSEIGLTPIEYNEFIVFWYPKMKNNNYNLIHFADNDYTDTAQLNITPKPDSLLRVFMVYKSLDEPVNIEKQEIKHFIRKGFTVVEWGGTEIR